MNEHKYMNTVTKSKEIIRFGATLYAFAIILFMIILDQFLDFNSLSSFAKTSYILIILIMITSVFLFYTKEMYGAYLSIALVTSYNVLSLLFPSVKALDLQMNLFFLPGAAIIFLYFFEKAIQSEKVDYQILVSKYSQLELNSRISKSISDITPKMLINDNLDELLQTILEKAIELIPKAQSGSILIRHENQMEFRAAVGYDLEELQKVNLKFEDTYQYKLNKLYEPTVIQDIKTFNKKNLETETNDFMSRSDLLTAKAVLTCSFVLNDTIYGFINLDNLDDFDAFNEQDKLYIKHLSSQIEIALNNHLLVEEIYTLSKTDTLTGVNSRKHHERLIRNVLNESIEKNKVFSIAVMDVNYLKKINDTYGHMVGDEYLIYFTKIIKESLKAQDIFSRTGGDEFVIIFPELDLHQSLERVDLIRKSFNDKPFIYEDLKHVVDFGCGVACYPKDDEELMGLMRIADKRMYDNKRERKLTK